MFDVTGTVWTELRFHIYTKCFGETIIDVNEILTPTVCNIECLTCGRRRSETCLEIRLNDILDISEVS